jgi:cysteine-rich repeat protein
VFGALLALAAPCVVGNCLAVIESGEAVCDDGIDNDDDGRVDCDDEGCVFAVACSACGNGVVEDGEACDDGDRVDGDGCSARCLLERCGNGVLDDDEVCDDGNLDGGDGCSARCEPDRCGDAVLQADEFCEDGNHQDGDGCDRTCRPEGVGCEERSPVECIDGNVFSGDGCSSSCRFEFCGDGIVQPTLGERCDDAAPGAAEVGCTGCQITSPDPE